MAFSVCIHDDVYPIYQALEIRDREQLDEILRLLSEDPFPDQHPRIIREQHDGGEVVYSWWDRYVRHVIYYTVDERAVGCQVMVVQITDPTPEFFETGA